MNEPFEIYGTFHIGRVNGRRCLVFVRHTGTVGASKCFSRKQAFTRSKVRPVEPGPTMSETLLRIMQSKGLPVSTETDELDDTTALAVEKEVFG